MVAWEGGEKMADKIKTSELLKKMIYNSKSSYISENQRFLDSIKLHSFNNTITFDDVLDMLVMSQEFVRVSMVKTMLKTLQDYSFIENDIDLFNDDLFLKVLNEESSHAINDIKLAK